MKTEVFENLLPKSIPHYGYKQTEVGLIPEDWKVVKVNDVLVFLDGRRKPIKDSDRNKIKGDFPYYGASGIIDFVNDFIYDEELILLGEDGENIISRNLPLAFVVRGKIWVNNHAHVLRPKPGFDINYLAAVLENINYEKYNTGTAQPKLNQRVCSDILLPIADSSSEQTAIATALSDADALIRSLEQLIEKKKKIKQGTMQELLRPKEGWVRRRLGDECELITKGTTPTSIGRNFQLRGINFIKIESLAESGDIIDDKVAFIDEETNSLLKRSQIREGDLLFSIAGALGRVALVKLNLLPANTNQALAIIRLKQNSNIDVNYLYHYLKHEPIQNHILMINVQGAQANLSLRNIDEFQIEMPDLKSQIQISSILNLLEIQIFNLKMKLEKAQLIKQGMMQNLLTGKIRLI